MWSFIASFASGALNAILGTVGKTITDIHADNTTRYKNEGDAGNRLADTTVRGSTESGAQRAEIQKSQGTWGPFGLAGFVLAMMFAYHGSMIILDSTSWHIGLTTVWYVVPWFEWRPHVVGSWNIAALPGKWEETEHAILQALFYVGPPSAALVIAAKAFRR
jgi:hypothetical protein